MTDRALVWIERADGTLEIVAAVERYDALGHATTAFVAPVTVKVGDRFGFGPTIKLGEVEQ